MRSLAEYLWHQLGAEPTRQVAIHVASDGSDRVVTAMDLARSSQAMRLRVEALGLAERSLVAIVHKSGPLLHAAWLGTLWAGHIPTMVAPPSPRMEPRKYAEGFRSIMTHLGIDAVVIDAATRATLADLMPDLPEAETEQLVPSDPTEPATWDVNRETVVQHTSGTTGAQKAIGFTSQQIFRHAEALQARVELGPEDIVASWLPLYHDMGFIACFVTPLALGVPIVEMSPFDWVAKPGLLFDAIERHRATVCWLPNFAFKVLSEERFLSSKEGHWDLGHVKAFISCSEPVQADAMSGFAARLAPHGVRRDQLIASYAMAENLFLVSQNRIGAPAEKSFDQRILETEQRAQEDPDGMILVSNGPVSDTTGIEVRGAEGPLPEGRVGELYIRGTHLFDGYRNHPEINAQVIDAERWYHTGDLGFVLDGDVFVTGRIKDLIIIRGRNYYPHDIEALIGEIEGVNPGRIVAFGIPDERSGTERLIVMVELLSGHEDRSGPISLAIRKSVAQSLDTTIGDLRIVPPRTLVKSTAGKVARTANRQRYLEMAQPKVIES